MFVGPVFSRELATAPRRPRLYVARAVYVAALLVLMSTAWLLLTGTQIIRNVGDFARFGAILFQILAPLQLTLALFFSAIFAAVAVAHEKDRRTLVLLLLTNLSNSELVVGKLLASLLHIFALVLGALPLFMLSALFGGVSFEQIARVYAVTLGATAAAGSLGSTLGLWREKTFQTLALTVLALVFWLAAGEAIALGATGQSWAGISTQAWSVAISPWRAILEATQGVPRIETGSQWFDDPIHPFLVLAIGLTVLLNGLAIWRVRVWNPSRETRPASPEAQEAATISESELTAVYEHGLPRRHGLRGTAEPQRSIHAAPGRYRRVWDNPVLWREIRTWAYGRRVLVVRLAYLLFFGLAAVALHHFAQQEHGISRVAAALTLVPLFVLSLVLINAQAVTSITAERDTSALDLLLVTDLTAQEFVFGKLGGVFYNVKEMMLLPMALCCYLWLNRAVSGENLIYLLGGLATMYVFVAMLGVHAGMSYDSSRSAIGVSLGTVFFLFLGIATCMRMMVAFSGSFQVQLQPFLAFMLGGGAGLYVALGARNPSLAIGVASFVCPIATFYAITSFLLGYTLTVFLVVLATYGFATAAMLVPAIFEFDVATGRAASDE